MASPADRGRLSEQGYQLTNRAKTVALNINGKPVHAYQGDTVASALYASGIRIFSRSFKYHRSRGLLCVSGQCANCLVTVDGIPNVRACTERVVVTPRTAIESVGTSLMPHVNAQIGSQIDPKSDQH